MSNSYHISNQSTSSIVLHHVEFTRFTTMPVLQLNRLCDCDWLAPGMELATPGIQASDLNCKGTYVRYTCISITTPSNYFPAYSSQRIETQLIAFIVCFSASQLIYCYKNGCYAGRSGHPGYKLGRHPSRRQFR